MFKASTFEFRHRYLLHCVVYCLAFAAPWNYLPLSIRPQLDGQGANPHFWGSLAAALSHAGIGGNRGGSYECVLVAAILCATLGAFLRTWGSAYLGANIVQSSSMHSAQSMPDSGILRDGPFRFMRNPLYMGTFLHTLALSLLMPLTGAIFAIVAIGLIQIRLILAEEAYLSAKIGPPYAAYCALVPRLLPALRPKLAAAGLKPRWPQAFLGEVYFWGVAGSFAIAGWSYNTLPLLQCVVVSFGVSLLARSVVKAPVTTA